MRKNINIPEIRFCGFKNEWNFKKIGDFYDFKNGLNKGKDFFGEGTPIVNFSDVFNNRGLYAEQLKGRVLLDKVEINNYEVKKGDIFFTRTSETIEEIGFNSVMLDIPQNTVFSGFVLRGRCFIAQDPIENIFKQYVFFTEHFRIEMRKKSTMTTRALTSGTAIKDMGFYFPEDKIEQLKIGNYIDYLDKIIDLQEIKYKKIMDVKKSMLYKLFPKEGADTPELRFNRFKGAWKKKKLGDCFLERIESFPEGELLSVTINHGIKKFSDLDRKNNSNEDKSKYKKVYVGDIAYNSMRMWQGASGYSPYEGIVSPAYTVLSPNEDIDSKCFSYLFKRPDIIHMFQLYSKGITSDNWNLKYPDFKKLEVYISDDVEEQKAIGKYFYELDKLIQLNKEKLEKLKSIKSSLIDRMFV